MDREQRDRQARQGLPHASQTAFPAPPPEGHHHRQHPQGGTPFPPALPTQGCGTPVVPGQHTSHQQWLPGGSGAGHVGHRASGSGHAPPSSRGREPAGPFDDRRGREPEAYGSSQQRGRSRDRAWQQQQQQPCDRSRDRAREQQHQQVRDSSRERAWQQQQQHQPRDRSRDRAREQQHQQQRDSSRERAWQQQHQQRDRSRDRAMQQQQRDSSRERARQQQQQQHQQQRDRSRERASYQQRDRSRERAWQQQQQQQQQQQRGRSRDRVGRPTDSTQDQVHSYPGQPHPAAGPFPHLEPAGSQYQGSSQGYPQSAGFQQPYQGADPGRSRWPAHQQQGYNPAAAAAAGAAAAAAGGSGQGSYQQPTGGRQGWYGQQGPGPAYSTQQSGIGPSSSGYGGLPGGTYAGSSTGPVWGLGPGGSGGPGGGYRGQQGGYGSGGREAGRVQPGAHAAGVSAQHSTPYGSRSRSGGQAGGSNLQGLEQGQAAMLAVLAGKQHFFLEAGPAAGSSRQLIERRRQHGSVAHKMLDVVVNLFRLNVSRKTLYHYDVSFERQRSSSSSAPAQGADAAAAAAVRAPSWNKPPEDARGIMNAFVEQYFVDDQGRPLKEAWAFDGGKNFVTAHCLKLRGSIQLPQDKHGKLTLPVRDVPVAGKGRNATWQVTLQLARELTCVDEINQIPARVTQLLAEGRDTTDVIQTFFDTRQALEWVLKQALIAAHEVMEVRRTLYFAENLGNRNIGGGMRAVIGLSTGIKQGESQVLFAADLTASAFLRTDINLVQWMADVAGFHRQPAGGGGRGAGRGGPGGGRGRGRSLPEVGEPDVPRLMSELRRDSTRGRLLRLFERTLRNKRVVYRDLQGNVIRKFTALGFTPEPADQAMFYCHFKQPAADGQEGADISVAFYFEHFANPKQPLAFPQLPAVVMKVPKPKEGHEPRKMWIPPERLWFDSNQRIQAVTHKGGTEQMIEAARKQPAELAKAIQQPIIKATTDSSSSAGGGSSAGSSGSGSSIGGKQLLSSMKVELDSSMQQIKARVLPGPWLSYRQGRAGREDTRSFNTGTSGTWNMTGFKFSNPASLRSWGILALLPRRDAAADQPRNPGSLSMWVCDFIKRCVDLGMDLGFNPKVPGEAERLRDRVLADTEWLEAGENAPYSAVEAALTRVRERAGGHNCQLILCFISHKPSGLYSRIKVASELVNASGGLALVTQVVVASKTDLGSFARGPPNANRRSQYQANLAMKVNAKVGGVNTCWSVLGHELLCKYFNKEVPAIQVFGIDITHPGKVPGARSKAAVVGSTDPAFCRYAQSYWEESTGGSEVLSRARLQAAFTDLIRKYYSANNGVKPGCLLVYRDGVSDSELDRVRVDEVTAIIEACASLQEDGGYRPRVVYVVVQKRHHVRLFDASAPGQLRNVEPGTVIDHTIVSPAVADFYLNSHKDIQGAGTNRATRYICLLDELGFGPDGLHVFTYWMCYLYCRCTRAVSVVAPVYYAHLLAYRVRVLDDGDGSASWASGSSGGGRQEPCYCDSLADKMFFV